MAKIEFQDPMLHKLNNELTSAPLRPYLGLSGIGNPCHRSLQYYHYWAYTDHLSSRISRLFGVGHSAEADMVASLAEVGITVTDDQKSIEGMAGHWKGHIDGIGNGEFLVEFKTHNDKSFKDLKKKKVAASKPMHYHQMQAYMGYLELPTALYMAYNKNDSEYYIEWIDFNPDVFDGQKRKQLEIIASDALLPRIGNNTRSWFECKFCNASAVCFGDKEPAKNCRTCNSVDVLEDGLWSCNKVGEGLTEQDQRKGCEEYSIAEIFK